MLARKEAKSCVLVIEDEPELARLLCMRLGDEGIRTLHCARATEAVQRLENQRFDCVVLDLKLEQGSGESIVTHMRSQACPFNQKTPILLMSGFLQKDLLRSLGKDIDDALVKPFEAQVFVRKVLSLSSARK